MTDGRAIDAVSRFRTWFAVRAVDLGLSPATAAVLVVAALIVGAWFVLVRDTPDADAGAATIPFAPGSTDASVAPTPTSPSTSVVVHAAGAVRSPGLYVLPAGSRVADLVEAAGGAGRRADTDGVNLAAELVDGQQIVLPRRGGPAAAIAATAVPSTGTGTDPPAAPVDLNTAESPELETLSGVGPATAAAILEYRAVNGPFATVDELLQVPGIGEVTLERLRPAVTV